MGFRAYLCINFSCLTISNLSSSITLVFQNKLRKATVGHLYVNALMTITVEIACEFKL